jgi:hypothetical protein
MAEKWKTRFEYEIDGPLVVVRPHRQFFGRHAVTEPLYVEIDAEENEPIFAGICDASEIALFDDPSTVPGRATLIDKVKAPGIVVTPDPLLFGTDADRKNAGKDPFVELKFGEWNVLNRHSLGF